MLLPRMLALKEKTGLKEIVTCHINDFLPFPKKQLYPLVKKDMYRKVAPQQNVHRFTDLVKEQPGGPLEDLSAWADPAAILYTGGTTGLSKGVMLTHASLSANVQQFAAWIQGVKEGEKLLAVYPYFHSAGFTAMQNYPLWARLEAIPVPRPSPDSVADMVRQFKPDYLPGVPTIFNGLLSNKDFTGMDLSFIKGFFAGAAPLPMDTYNRLMELTGKQIRVYGLTECTLFATASPWKVNQGGHRGLASQHRNQNRDFETGQKEMPAGKW